MRPFLFALCCSLLPTAVAAQSYRAENWLIVVPLNTQDFEVIEDFAEGARGIWCAAASFAQTQLGLPGVQRLYVKTPRGPSVSGVGRKGVVFTTDPDRAGGAAAPSYSVTVRRVGENLTSDHARLFCRDYVIELDDL